MRLLIVSSRGDYLPLAMRFQREGHAVSFYVKEVERRNIGHNLVNCVSNIPKDQDITLLDLDQCHEFSQKMPGKVLHDSEFVDFLCNDVSYLKDLCDTLELPYNPKLVPDNSVEAFFNGDRFVLPIFSHKYHTTLFSGNIGPVLDAGFAMVETSVESCFSPRYKATLGKIEKALKRNGYKGLLRVELKGDTAVKFDHRMNIPTTYECIAGRLSDTLKALVNNELKSVPHHQEKAYGVKVSIPPFPYCPKFFWQHGFYHINGMPLCKYDNDGMKHFWPLHVARDGNGTLVSAGHSGDLGYITARAGLYTREAKRRIKRTISLLGIPNLQYRDDICS